MRISEKFMANMQKYMIITAVILTTVVLVSSFLFNAVFIKTKNDDLMPVDLSKKAFYSAGSSYEINPYDSNEPTVLVDDSYFEEIVVYDGSPGYTARISFSPGNIASSNRTAQAAAQANSAAAKKQNSANNANKAATKPVETSPDDAESPTEPLPIILPTLPPTTEPKETVIPTTTVPETTFTTTEPTTTEEVSTEPTESTCETEFTTEPTESTCPTETTEPISSTAPTEVTTENTQNTEQTEATTDLQADNSENPEAAADVDGTSAEETELASSKKNATTAPSSTQGTSYVGASENNKEKNGNLNSVSHNYHNVTKISSASIFTPAVIVILIILAVVGFTIRYRSKNAEGKHTRHNRRR